MNAAKEIALLLISVTTLQYSKTLNHSHHPGLLCSHCDRVTDPLDCKYTTYCDENQACHVAQFVSSQGHLFYRLGCKDKHECHALHVGRRENGETVFVEKCCTKHPECNRDIYKKAKEITCGSCSAMASPTHCEKVTTCRSNEVCVRGAYISDEAYLRYNLDCIKKDYCGGHVLHRALTDDEVKDLCCDIDYCNMGENMNRTTTVTRKPIHLSTTGLPSTLPNSASTTITTTSTTPSTTSTTATTATTPTTATATTPSTTTTSPTSTTTTTTTLSTTTITTPSTTATTTTTPTKTSTTTTTPSTTTTSPTLKTTTTTTPSTPTTTTTTLSTTTSTTTTLRPSTTTTTTTTTPSMTTTSPTSTTTTTTTPSTTTITTPSTTTTTTPTPSTTITTTTTTPSTTTTTTTTTETMTPSTTTTTTTTSTPTTIKTTTTAVPTGVLCQVCSSFACFVSHDYRKCDYPTKYCYTNIKVSSSGQVAMTKTCASKQTCEKLWWEQTSDREECVNLHQHLQDQIDFSCDYCCTTDRCNTDDVPPTNTLYRGS
ncbi:hepatitis A virus cellular receptor 1-like [Haliotis asinina]|uniref:hepatitis A virus cellular receptor 1-like n=1 Tax=Haliotis asinina TaxID=109174 RepID=UPI003531F456